VPNELVVGFASIAAWNAEELAGDRHHKKSASWFYMGRPGGGLDDWDKKECAVSRKVGVVDSDVA
jgi:hypothetical protein